MSLIRQPSLFGVESVRPGLADLAGLLAANGEISRRGGAAQLVIIVDHPWRSAALVAECTRRGVAATSVATGGASIAVRTAYSPLLVALAETWTHRGVVVAPAGLALDAHELRLWVMAAGRRESPTSYVLPVRHSVGAREPIGAALAALGLGAQLVSPRGYGNLSYRIVGKRRITRLVEMIGDPPKLVPRDIWPS